MSRKSGDSNSAPLLTVSQVAVLLGCDRSTLYKAIVADRFPLPVVKPNRRILVPRVAVERLLGRVEGHRPPDDPPAIGPYCPTCGVAPPSTVVASRTRATCSAARRSSVAIPSV
jgi:excisionase family DNA binding protein